MESTSKKIIQSYVYTDFGNFFVSTIYRLSSAMVVSWFYETFVWKLNNENEREPGILYEGEGLNCHYEVCKHLIKDGKCEDKED